GEGKEMAVAELKELREKLSGANNKMNDSGRLSMIARHDARNGYPICNKDFATVEKLVFSLPKRPLFYLLTPTSKSNHWRTTF
ncbi:hypothetical protein BYT27DRAFT_7196074, partial [Phlegmacium glaucopus]